MPHIGVVVGGQGISHAMAEGLDPDLLPRDDKGRTVCPTVCSKSIVVARIISVGTVEAIRCRPCKNALYQGRHYTVIRKG